MEEKGDAPVPPMSLCGCTRMNVGEIAFVSYVNILHAFAIEANHTAARALQCVCERSQMMMMSDDVSVVVVGL